jgi:hypothetical protein
MGKLYAPTKSFFSEIKLQYVLYDRASVFVRKRKEFVRKLHAFKIEFISLSIHLFKQ